MAYVREQLEAYREDVTSRLQSIGERLVAHAHTDEQIEDRLAGILDVLESTVDVFLRHDAAMEMQLQVLRLWVFLSYLMPSNRAKTMDALKFINNTKDSLNERLNEMWKSPLDRVVPTRNLFREELKQLARESNVFD
jgi:hypothetical protein